MDDAMRVLLEQVRHRLTTLTGLEVCDGAAPDERWTIDERLLIAKIDKALPPGPGLLITPSNATPEQLAAIDAHWNAMLKRMDGMRGELTVCKVIVPEQE